ncbi:MAG: DUF4230 domain-containing protein [Candidatus Magasanikbacteria bacterium]
MKKILSIISILLLFGGGLYLGYRIFSPNRLKTEVTREVLLTSLQSEGFLVSQTAILSETVTIDRKSGSAFKDFFWGQELLASAKMKVSSGVDLSKIIEEDIEILLEEVRITLPAVSIHSVELVDTIQMQNKQGILKKIFDNDDGYNEALVQLTESARSAAMEDELVTEAENSAKGEIERLVRFVERNKTVTILTR